MKKLSYTLLAVFALLSLCLTACNPDVELKDSGWTTTLSTTVDDGEPVVERAILICNTASSGVLFLEEIYSEEDIFDVVLPFTYNWDGQEGTINIDANLPDEGPFKTSIPVSYDKKSGLTLNLTALRSADVATDICSQRTFSELTYSKPSSMVGTEWETEHTEIFGEDDERFGIDTIVQTFTLRFSTESQAILAYREHDFGDPEEDGADYPMQYSYSKGLGLAAIQFEEETTTGGFYLPNASTLYFSDGMSLLILNKK